VTADKHPFRPACAICVNTEKPPWKPATTAIPAPKGNHHICAQHAATIEASGAKGTLWDILSALQNARNPTPGANAT
jgi:hypothetical protein